MGFLFKKRYNSIELPFRLDDRFEDDREMTEEALFIDLVFYGFYRDERMYFAVTFQYYNEAAYDRMVDFLKQHEDRTAVRINVNEKKIQDFKVDLDDMAQKLSDPEIRKFKRIVWAAYDETMTKHIS